MHIYVLSGLGADESIFQKLDFGTWEPFFIQWIEPLDKESLESYAARLLVQVKTERPVLLGVSFGGMLAVEMAKIIDCQQVILISSAAVQAEIPGIYRFLGHRGILPFIPAGILKQANFFTFRLFGMRTKEEKYLLKNILQRTDPGFLKWAMYSIVHWENQTLPPKIFRLHGDADRILPLGNMQQVEKVISGGGHLMVYSLADSVSEILYDILK